MVYSDFINAIDFIKLSNYKSNYWKKRAGRMLKMVETKAQVGCITISETAIPSPKFLMLIIRKICQLQT
tara:strand:+ start:308 stop:514 length:207 start_codon:yes stop_codon:yes gene_type:complete